MYVLIVILSAGFTSGAFAFRKLYQSHAGGGMRSSLLFIAGYAATGAFLLCIGSDMQAGVSETGAALAAGQAFLIVCVQYLSVVGTAYGGILVLTMFLTLGATVIPFFGGILFFQESVNGWRIAGIVCMLLSLLLPVLFTKKGANGRPKRYYAICAAAFILNGLAPVCSKLKVLYAPGDALMAYQCAIMAFVFLLSGAALLTGAVSRRMTKGIGWLSLQNGCLPLVRHDTGGVFLYLVAAMFALCACIGDYLSLFSLTGLDVSVQSPLNMGLLMVFTACIGKICFKEKISRVTSLSLAAALTGVLFMAI